MKILFLAPFGIRPKGTLIARMLPLAVELQTLGHQVVIVAPPYTNPEDSGKVESVQGVTIRNIRLGPQNEILSVPVLSWRMFKAARDEQPDIIHLFKPKGFGGFAVMLMLFLQRIGVKLPPLLVDSDDWEGKGGINELHPYSAAEKFVFRIQENLLLSRADGVTAASLALQSMVSAMRGSGERLLYLPNCVKDLPASDGAAVRQTLGISAGTPVVLLYTRFFEFEQDKLHFLFAEIYRQVPDVRFLVVGKGRNGEEELLQQVAAEKGFASALLMAGWLQPMEIPSYLAAADVALYPFGDTLVNRSKCPAKVTEILLAGVPVVADNVGQLAVYIKAGYSGILCAPDNWQEMADNAVRLLLDRDAARAIGPAGRSYLLDSFNWKNYAAKLEVFYRAAAGINNKDNNL